MNGGQAFLLYKQNQTVHNNMVMYSMSDKILYIHRRL